MSTSLDKAEAPGTGDQPPVRGREHPGLELLAVLGVSLGFSGLSSLLYFIRAEITVKGGIGATTACVQCKSATTYPWLDFFDQLLSLLGGLVGPLLALVMLARVPGGPGFGVGFDFRRFLPSGLRQTRRQRGSRPSSRERRSLRERLDCDLLVGIGLFAAIGIPGLLLVYAAHELGLAASLEVTSFPDVFYRIPYLVASAFQNGLSEEIIVVGFMLTRLRQLGWTDNRALMASSILRGSYHLYQGFGGFAGNFVMGLIFGRWFQRTNRVLPLVIAHGLLDTASFVGYLYLHNRISWI